MIELIITIAILSFGIIGVYSAFSPIATLNYTIASRATAAYLAQEGFEIVRNIRDTNFIKIRQGAHIAWSDGLLQCTLGCQLDYKAGTLTQASENILKSYDQQSYLAIDADGFYSYDHGAKTPFTRKVTITQQGSTDALKVNVMVIWNYNGRAFNFETEGYLYNYQ